MLLLKVMLLPMMIKALLATRQPLLCAAIYGAALFTNALLFDLAFGQDPLLVAGRLALSTSAAFSFFWLLKETEDTGPGYWVVLAVGVALMVFVVP